MSEPTQEEIDNVLNECMELQDAGKSKFHGMSYEQGVSAAVGWMQGNEPNPMED